MLEKVKAFGRNQWVEYLKPFQNPEKSTRIAVAYGALTLAAGIFAGLAWYYRDERDYYQEVLDDIHTDLDRQAYYLRGYSDCLHTACKPSEKVYAPGKCTNC